MRKLGQMAAIAAVVLTPALAHAQLPIRIQQAQGQRPIARNGRVIYGNQTNDRNRGIFTSNDRIFVNRDGRRCVQQIDRFGHRQTVCADGDHDWDDRVVARAEHERNRQRDMDDRRWKHKYDKHHDDRRFDNYKRHDNGLHLGQLRRAHEHR